MMREVEHLSRNDSLPIQTEWAHVRCIAHVIHLAVGQLLRPLKPPQIHSFHDFDIRDDEFNEELRSYPIAKIICFVRKVRKS